MSAKSAINKEVFIPHDEKMLAAVQVRRRTKKKIPFLATGGQGDYMTFICLSGQRTNDSLFSSLLFSSCCCNPKSHFNTSPLILALMFRLMSMFMCSLPIGWHANSICGWALGQSFLNKLDLNWNWIIVSAEIEVQIILFSPRLNVSGDIAC